MPSDSFDRQRYAQLLAETVPGVIETPEEHDRLLTAAEGLMEKGDQLSPEERKLLTLLVFLIEAFEQMFEDEEDEEEAEASEPPSPHQALRHLMQARGLEVQDISDLFGNPHIAREVLEGRREISKTQAKALGSFFRVPPKLFLP